MSDTLETKVLAEALAPHIQGQRVKAAVFLTYSFEPDFFEMHILPTLLPGFQRSPSDAIAIWQLEDALRNSIGDIAVYYDRRGLTPRERSAKLDIRRIPCTVRTGYFHPKVLLALATPTAAEPPTADKLIVLVTSANLTQSGWWENVEVAHIESIDARDMCPFRNDLLDLLASVRKHAIPDADHSALDTVRHFIRDLTESKRKKLADIPLLQLFVGQEPLAEWLKKRVHSNRGQLALEVISPFFDNTEAKPLKDLMQVLAPAEVRLFLPEGPDGAAACTKKYFDVVAGIENVSWGQLPKSLITVGKGEKRSLRRVHAKVYRMFDRSSRYEAVLIGSVNLTSAAHQRGGNLEAAFLIESEPRAKPDWWLSSDAPTPGTFENIVEEQQEPQPNVRLAIRYDWNLDNGEMMWDDTAPSRAVCITAQGSPLFTKEGIPARRWVPIENEDAVALRDALQVTSFLLIREEGSEYTVLVDESNMSRKPSVRHELSVADILKSWSLFTPELRSAFLEERGSALAESLRQLGIEPSERLQSSESFFDLHAGIFLAFGNLKRRIVEALDKGNDKEIEYWLLGKQYDSLLTVIERAHKEAANDQTAAPIRVYLMLLCTKQLVDAITDDHPRLRERYAREFGEIDVAIGKLPDLRARFDFDTAEERQKFFKWLEKWFLQRAIPAEAT